MKKRMCLALGVAAFLVVLLALTGCSPPAGYEFVASGDVGPQPRVLYGAIVRDKSLDVRTEIYNSVSGQPVDIDDDLYLLGTATMEGATADAYETLITVTDPTADITVTLPNAGGTVMLSSLATNGADAANAVTGASNALVFEGSAADEYETSLGATNPTADRSIVLPDLSGTVHVNSARQASRPMMAPLLAMWALPGP